VPSPFSLASVGNDALAVAEALGIAGFATLGHSGGGPFALAAAVVGGRRVTAVGIAAGVGPFELVPHALDDLTEDDRAAHALLPGDPDGAARGFGVGFDELARLRLDDAAMLAALAPGLSTRDRELMEDSVYGHLVISSMREGLSAGVQGAGWDNVAWIGPWDIDLSQVCCPVHLWYGEDDLMVSPAHGQWLRDHVPDGTLTVRPGEGHLSIAEHLREILLAVGGLPG
jgi:pimeloyl-ACP methyl ester carboxylesterase